ncbi:MAG: hypothetical protein NTZ42_03945 [Candidatus Gribaldobacteria bacterium]|nr:hypothetical protein [Candidatus Gribaldobacteria bacterium]
MKKQFTQEEAREIGENIGVDFGVYDLEEFRMGLGVEIYTRLERMEKEAEGE